MTVFAILSDSYAASDTGLLAKDEARRNAANIAKLPELLSRHQT